MRRRSALLIAAASGAIATMLVGGVAWATIPGDGGLIQGCYTKVGGILRVIDTDKGQHCLGIEAPITWSQKGPKGDPGANGANGTPGTSPTVAQLQPGDSNCPAGGAAITDASGTTAYVCGGAKGADGQSFAGTFTSPNGEYSINVTDTGIVLSHGPNTSVKLAGDNLDLRSVGSTQVRAGTTAEIRSGSTATIHADSNFVLEAGSTGLIQSAAALSLKGSAINLN
jgi:hypothetical protein